MGGVPQGFMVGPILINAFIIDIVGSILRLRAALSV